MGLQHIAILSQTCLLILTVDLKHSSFAIQMWLQLFEVVTLRNLRITGNPVLISFRIWYVPLETMDAKYLRVPIRNINKLNHLNSLNVTRFQFFLYIYPFFITCLQ